MSSATSSPERSRQSRDGAGQSVAFESRREQTVGEGFDLVVRVLGFLSDQGQKVDQREVVFAYGDLAKDADPGAQSRHVGARCAVRAPVGNGVVGGRGPGATAYEIARSRRPWPEVRARALPCG